MYTESYKNNRIQLICLIIRIKMDKKQYNYPYALYKW